MTEEVRESEKSGSTGAEGLRRGSMRTRPSASSETKSGGGRRDAHSLLSPLSSPLCLSAFLPANKPQIRTSDFLYICQTSWYLILREWELFGGRFGGTEDERSVLFAWGGGHREFDVAFFSLSLPL